MLEDDREPIVLVERQAAQDDGVDDGEDGGSGADAEREHGERDDREGGRGAERAQRGFDVVKHGSLAR